MPGLPPFPAIVVDGRSIVSARLRELLGGVNMNVTVQGHADVTQQRAQAAVLPVDRIDGRPG